MNTTETTATDLHLNAIMRLEKSHTTTLATTGNRIKYAKQLLSWLLLEVQSSDEPRFTFEQCDLFEKRFYEIRVALEGE